MKAIVTGQYAITQERDGRIIATHPALAKPLTVPDHLLRRWLNALARKQFELIGVVKP